MEKNEIFVFGSNRKGIHGAGAAKFAMSWCDARYGTGEGLTGRSYALPTKNSPSVSLSFDELRESVDRFKHVARAKPDLTFIVSRVGCGLAGFTDDQVAPLFFDAPDNCRLPGVWMRRKDPDVVRLVVAGSRNLNSSEAGQWMVDHLNAFVSALPEDQSSRLEIVSGGARGVDNAAAAWARYNRFTFVEFLAQWNRFGMSAGYVRNTEMALYGTHLAAFWDGESRGTAHMIEAAKGGSLQVEVFKRDAATIAQRKSSAARTPRAAA